MIFISDLKSTGVALTLLFNTKNIRVHARQIPRFNWLKDSRKRWNQSEKVHSTNELALTRPHLMSRFFFVLV
jgi:hypothetical protein